MNVTSPVVGHQEQISLAQMGPAHVVPLPV